MIVALLNRSERFHLPCRQAIESIDRPLVTWEAVIAESCYLLRNLPGGAQDVVENVERGIFQVKAPTWHDAGGVRRWMAKYASRKINLADACLIAIATELETGDILTLDRDLAIYRWAS